jgi:propanol-preferring alcohol dehydrogenase
MMCSSATSFHALKKARLSPGETVVVYGLGGLGMSAIQLARIMGAGSVVGVDMRSDRRELAEAYGAVFLNADDGDAAERVLELTGGVDVAVDFTGSPEILGQAVRSLSAFGRLAVVAITDRLFPVNTYRDLIGREASIVGVSDHLLSELPVLIGYAAKGLLDLSHVVSRSVPLEAASVNCVLDELDAHRAAVRSVIEPGE